MDKAKSPSVPETPAAVDVAGPRTDPGAGRARPWQGLSRSFPPPASSRLPSKPSGELRGIPQRVIPAGPLAGLPKEGPPLRRCQRILLEEHLEALVTLLWYEGVG